MREKYILAIRVLATLLAAELVLVGSFYMTRGQSSQKIIPTISISYDTFPGSDSINEQTTLDPSTLLDSDIWERQTGEAMLDQEDEQTTPSPEITEEGYPAPEETLVEETLEDDEFLPPPGDPFEEEPTLDEDEDTLPTSTQQATPRPTRRATSPQVTPTTNNPTAIPRATATPPEARPTPLPNTSGDLVSIHVESAPKLDGKADDESWKNAPSLVVLTQGGVNASATQVMLRSVYNDKRIYFLLTWADPTHSQLYQPWEKQKDGSWEKITGAGNDGGDENEFAEDKIALMWPIAKNIDDFNNQGCGIACHSGENPDTKPFGNKYMPEKDQMADLWVWKSVRNVGQVDDLYLDSTRYADDQRAAGRKGDPREDGGYRNNGGDSPEFMLSDSEKKDGLPGFILDDNKEKLDNDAFQAGERVPAFITAPFSGDRGDLAAAWRYQDGQWILEFSRVLETGSDVDVQFSDLSKLYSFALATFDNTQVRHAVQDGVIQLRFEK